jgi:hypothetical protein
MVRQNIGLLNGIATCIQNDADADSFETCADLRFAPAGIRRRSHFQQKSREVFIVPTSLDKMMSAGKRP